MTARARAALAFAVRMAWRETRAGWRHFLGLFACVALGVAALVGVGSFATSLDRTLALEGRALMGGDLEVRATRPLDPASEARIAALAQGQARVTRTRELVGMARHPDRGTTVLVEIKAVDDRYPLYGRLEHAPAGALGDLLGADGALVQDVLLARLGLRVGDGLVVGSARFTVTGVVQREPDRSAGIFTLGPRVLLSQAGLDRTGLVGYGSRVRHRALVRLPEGADPGDARAALTRALTDPTVRVATFAEAQPGLRRFFVQLNTYLGLVGLVSLLVGGIGVAASVGTFIRRKLLTVATLKSLGAASGTLLCAYLVQTLILGGLGSVAGIGLVAYDRLPVLGWFGVCSMTLIALYFVSMRVIFAHERQRRTCPRAGARDGPSARAPRRDRASSTIRTPPAGGRARPHATERP